MSRKSEARQNVWREPSQLRFEAPPGRFAHKHRAKPVATAVDRSPDDKAAFGNEQSAPVQQFGLAQSAIVVQARVTGGDVLESHGVS